MDASIFDTADCIYLKDAGAITGQSHHYLSVLAPHENSRVLMYITCARSFGDDYMKGIGCYGVEVFKAVGLMNTTSRCEVYLNSKLISIMTTSLSRLKTYILMMDNDDVVQEMEAYHHWDGKALPTAGIYRPNNRKELANIKFSKESCGTCITMDPSFSYEEKLAIVTLGVKYAENVYQTWNMLAPTTHITINKSPKESYMASAEPHIIDQPTLASTGNSLDGIFCTINELVLKCSGFNEEDKIFYVDCITPFNKLILCVFEFKLTNDLKMMKMGIVKDCQGRHIFTMMSTSNTEPQQYSLYLGSTGQMLALCRSDKFYDINNRFLNLTFERTTDLNDAERQVGFRYDTYGFQRTHFALIRKDGCCVNLRMNHALSGIQKSQIISYAMSTSINSFRIHCVFIPNSIKYTYGTQQK